MHKVKKCPCGRELWRNRTAKTFVIAGHTIEIPRSGVIWCGTCKRKAVLAVEARQHREQGVENDTAKIN